MRSGSLRFFNATLEIPVGLTHPQTIRQRAWTAIKATADEQRTLWLEVGVALMYGKDAANRPQVGKDSSGRPKYQKFSEWVADNFPGLAPRSADAAMWFCANSATMAEIPQVSRTPRPSSSGTQTPPPRWTSTLLRVTLRLPRGMTPGRCGKGRW